MKYLNQSDGEEESLLIDHNSEKKPVKDSFSAKI